jgi:sulfur carrier protein
MRTTGPANRRVKILAWVPGLSWSGLRVIQLSVNGQVRQLEPGANIERLLDALELAGKRVAVEKNGEIVPRSRYADTRLADGDTLEIVVAVGGG